MSLPINATPLELLRVALPEAQAWCASRSQGALRSLQTDEPDPMLRSMRLCPELLSGDPATVVRSVVEHRWYALGCPPRAPGAGLSVTGGRLLCYEPGRNLDDGAACAASRGFFDVHNTPPWDTWLCFADHAYLVAWVPGALLDRAAAGIEVNPEQCIRWAGDIDTGFTSTLRAEGLAP